MEKRTPISAADEKLIKARHKRGDTIRQISASTGLLVSTVYRSLKRAGVPMRKRGRPRSLDAKERKTAKKAYEKGTTISDLALMYSVSTPTMSCLLKLAGAKMRRGPNLVNVFRKRATQQAGASK